MTLHKWVEYTELFIITITVLVVSYDLVAVMFGGMDATVSRVLLNFCKKYPIVAFGLGVVIGHILWEN